MTVSGDFLQRPILNGRANVPVGMAPMVGLSHVALRTVVRSYLPANARTIWPTEMLSSWRLPKERLGATAETLRNPDETELVPQILGNEEEPIKESVRRLKEWGAEGIDINMGCPVQKALKHNYGVALMGDAGYAAEVVRMTVRNSQGLPVSVKLRAGLQNDLDYLLKFVQGLEGAGADWITLHPRLGAMKRRGSADWAQIRHVRERTGLAVIGNGDVQCADDVFHLNEISGCDSIMVGRALAARPWMLWQVGERLGFKSPPGKENRRAPTTPHEEGREFGAATHAFIDALERHFTFEQASRRFKFHLRMTAGWLEFGHHLFARTSAARDFQDLRARVDEFFAVGQKMVARTALRE